jgi:predicted porin
MSYTRILQSSALCVLLASTTKSLAGEASSKAPVDTTPTPAPSPLFYDFELKGRMESRTNNFDFNDSIDSLTDDTWLLYRSRVGLGYKFSDNFRIYAQGQDAREIDSDRPDIPGALGAEGNDPFDLRQLWFEVGNEKKGASLKVGRQQLLYGDQRLLGPLEWNNLGRAWDAAKFHYQGSDWWVDAFVSSFVRFDPDGFNKSDWFDNGPMDKSEILSGIYFSTTALGFQTTDLYAFHMSQDTAAGNTSFLSLGTRWKSTPGKFGPWDYLGEFVGQTGEVAGKDLTAFAGHTEVGYTFKHDWKPRLAVDYSYGTGDSNATDGKVGTFQNLYPTNHLYYGYLDAFSWQNISNIDVSFKLQPTTKLTLRADFHAFWLATTNDAWYRANGVSTVRPITPGASKQAATEVDFTATYAATKNLNFLVGYSHLFAGDYLAATGAADDADFFYVEATIKF